MTFSTQILVGLALGGRQISQALQIMEPMN